MLLAETVAVRGVVVARGQVRQRDEQACGAGAARARPRARVVATEVATGRVRPRDSDDGDADAAHVRTRARVVTAVVACGHKRVRDGDDNEESQCRVVRARHEAEAGGIPTPHQHDGGGILSGSGAV